MTNLTIVATGMGINDGWDGDMKEDINKYIADTEASVEVNIPGSIQNNENNTSRYNIWTEPPRKRAQDLYNAITEKNEAGEYKNDNIMITGGCSTEDVIDELKNIEKEQGALPDRGNNLRLFGFSDATQMQWYLGQKGVATPVVYSGSAKGLISDLEEESKTGKTPLETTLRPVNEAAENVDSLEGQLHSGGVTFIQTKHKEHRLRFNEEDKNILAMEPRNLGQFDALLSEMKQSGDMSKVSGIVLSCFADNQQGEDKSTKDLSGLQEMLKKHDVKIPVFYGVEYGHGDKDRDFRNVHLNMFSDVKIQKSPDGSIGMSWDKFAEPDRMKRQMFVTPSEKKNSIEFSSDSIGVNVVGKEWGYEPDRFSVLKNMDKKTINLNLPDNDMNPENSNFVMTQATDMPLKYMKERGILEGAKALNIQTEHAPSNEYLKWFKDFTDKHLKDMEVKFVQKNTGLTIDMNSYEKPSSEKSSSESLIDKLRGTGERNPAPQTKKTEAMSAEQIASIKNTKGIDK